MDILLIAATVLQCGVTYDAKTEFLNSISKDCYWYPMMSEVMCSHPSYWKKRWKEAKRPTHKTFWNGPNVSHASKKEIERLLNKAREYGIEFE